MGMKLSVIIVSYNVKYYLEQCLLAVFAAIREEYPTEVFVVDNASADGSVEYLRARFPKEKFPNLRLIENKRNHGFGQANNQAVKLAKGEYVLYLNPDTLVTENTLEDCLRFADGHPDLGALGVKMLDDSGMFAKESRRSVPTPWISFCKMVGLTALFPNSRFFGRYYAAEKSREEAQPIEIVSGAFMMVRHEEPLCLFDEDFFMYGEDIDLSYRLLQAGKRNYYLPTPIIHYKGESTHKSTYRYVHVFYQAILIFYRKHFKQSARWLNLPITLAIVIQAFLSLSKLYLRKVRRFLFPRKNMGQERMLYVGENSDRLALLSDSLCHRIAAFEGKGLSDLSDFVERSETKYDYVLFDLDSFSRAEILERLRRDAGKYYLATFSPSTGVLLTGGDVFVTNE